MNSAKPEYGDKVSPIKNEVQQELSKEYYIEKILEIHETLLVRIAEELDKTNKRLDNIAEKASKSEAIQLLTRRLENMQKNANSKALQQVKDALDKLQE